MIDISIVKIINNIKSLDKFYGALKKIDKLSKKYKILMGIDFEFNTKKVALMQILFEIHKRDKIIKKYYIIYPPMLDNETSDYLKYHIMSNLNILKILHGSESLDIPYIVEDLFNHEVEPLIDFFMSMVDTRYLCEYLNVINKGDNICRIYDLLVKLNVISEDEKQKLDLNEDKMGHIYETFIDINKLSDELITYAIHDVVYLTDAYEKLKKMIIEHNPKNYYLLLDLIRYCFMERRNVTNIGDDVIIINMMNNYFYYINKSNVHTEYMLSKITDTTSEVNQDYYYKINLLKTYDIILKDFIDSYDSVMIMSKINYLKTNLLSLFKTIVYIIILKYYRVKSSNTQIVEYDLNNNYRLIISSLKEVGLEHLLELIEKFYEFADSKLKP
jgi:hypothetical protein